MNDTESKIVEVTIEMVSRYGVKRTSMASVAEEAGVSRQTLYAVFSNKDHLLAAAMRVVVSKILAELKEDWQDCTSVDQILTAYFKHAVYPPYEMLKKTPDLIDLIHGVGEENYKVARECDADKSKALAEQLQPFSAQLKKNNSDAASVGKFIVLTSNELKFSVSSRRELDNMLHTLKQAINAMLEK